jgi:hypothetical protein
MQKTSIDRKEGEYKKVVKLSVDLFKTNLADRTKIIHSPDRLHYLRDLRNICQDFRKILFLF